ncbi:MAG: hypothetical protein M3Z08_09350 [Chloroflexota bacterium]|nr:hypothetical protein [Chloroflexota bacterium]
MQLEDIQQACSVEEEMGYDVPFTTLTWARWQELQVRTVQGFSRFQRAIERRQPLLAAFVALEIEELAIELHKEACAWLGQEKREV